MLQEADASTCVEGVDRAPMVFCNLWKLWVGLKDAAQHQKQAQHSCGLYALPRHCLHSCIKWVNMALICVRAFLNFRFGIVMRLSLT